MTLLLLLALFSEPKQVDSREALFLGIQEVYDAVILEDGNVDYAKLNASPELQTKLEAYINYIAALDPESLSDDHTKLAVLANAYNVMVLMGVNRNWPVTSVRDIYIAYGFFTRDKWQLNGRKISLNDLEKKYIRPLDPRSHFIINCASASCPVLPKQVITPEFLDAQMDRAAATFLKDPEKNRFEGDTWHLSKIFDWYKKDWGGEKEVIAYILSVRGDLEEPEDIRYLDYDWSLNGPTGK